MANYDSAEEAAGGARSAGADDWATEELWWRENYARRPYVRADRRDPGGTIGPDERF